MTLKKPALKGKLFKNEKIIYTFNNSNKEANIVRWEATEVFCKSFNKLASCIFWSILSLSRLVLSNRFSISNNKVNGAPPSIGFYNNLKKNNQNTFQIKKNKSCRCTLSSWVSGKSNDETLTASSFRETWVTI